MTVHLEQQPQQFDLMLEGEILKREDATETTDDEEMDVLEIIEEQSQTEDDDNNNNDEGDDSLSRPSAHEFSLSSLGNALGGAFQASTTTLGSATATLHSKGMEKLRESFSQMQVPSPRELVPSSDHSSRGMNDSSSSHRRVMFAVRKPRRRVDFGEFEPRAVRLQYTKEDIFNIASDPVQMEELRLALRSLGAVTDSMLKQKLHWYVKNSKRAREAEERERERMRQEQRRTVVPEEEKQAESEIEPSTPPTEQKLIDGDKVLEQASGALSSEDPSPKCVRGIFVPPAGGEE